MMIIPRQDHNITRKNISKHALIVLNRLHEAGYQSYLVGGSVRDLLLGIKPKDFDIATDAHPEHVRRLFRNSRIIGRRFRLIHVFFGTEIIEVATFRTAHPEIEHPEARQSHTGMLIRDNVYGSMEDDAWRRDFSINALYYNIDDYSVIDYTGGLKDLENHTIRILGDPVSRYTEDPVRMLRALRMAAKLDFTLEPETAKPISELNRLIKHVSPARLFDEVIKLFYCGHAMRAFRLLTHYGLFEKLFSQTAMVLAESKQEKDRYLSLILHSCNNTDQRLANAQSLNPAFLFSVLLWPALQHKTEGLMREGHAPYTASQMAARKVLGLQMHETTIPKRHSTMVQEIWLLQFPLQMHPKNRILTLFSNPRFRAAFDFLLLRMESGETQLAPAVQWWQEFQLASGEERQEKIKRLPSARRKKKK
ncbi:MAG TPA: polynucleotide adenylyltransferase PcnB [Gammaproteobacteria bacterium]|nr:polynucleotide adenylyltransferase PcnB [Gammaproteobacteria bacterium]